MKISIGVFKPYKMNTNLTIDEIIQFGLLPYLVLYFYVCVIYRKNKVRRSIGKNPITIKSENGLLKLISHYQKIAAILLLSYVLALFFLGNNFIADFFDEKILQLLGMFLLIISFLGTTFSQHQMGTSWRIGLDESGDSELVIAGIYKYSRNPIYLCLLISLVGLFLVSPNCISLFFLAAGFILISITITIEEDHLIEKHGSIYTNYSRKTRRYL